jgi:hypothetical protein
MAEAVHVGRDGVFVLSGYQQMKCALGVVREAGGIHDLRHGKAGSLLQGEPAHGPIGEPGHGGQSNRKVVAAEKEWITHHS